MPTELPTFPLHTSRFQDLETKNAKNGEIPEDMEEIDEGIAPTEQIRPEMADSGGQGRRPEVRSRGGGGVASCGWGKWGITPTLPAR